MSVIAVQLSLKRQSAQGAGGLWAVMADLNRQNLFTGRPREHHREYTDSCQQARSNLLSLIVMCQESHDQEVYALSLLENGLTEPSFFDKADPPIQTQGWLVVGAYAQFEAMQV